MPIKSQPIKDSALTWWIHLELKELTDPVKPHALIALARALQDPGEKYTHKHWADLQEELRRHS